MSRRAPASPPPSRAARHAGPPPEAGRPAGPPPEAGRAAWLALAAALAACALAYGAALDGDFHLDDWTSIQLNWRLRAPARLLDGASPLFLLGPERVVTDATWAADFALAGLSPVPFHAGSLAWHLAAALLGFALLRAALRGAGVPRADGLAAAAAALFALHPLQAEAVAYAAQRSEVLSAALALAALLALWRAAEAASAGRSAALAALGAALHLLALGAKTTAVTVPAAFLLLRLGLAGPGAPGPLARVRRALLVAAPCWALAAASTWHNLAALGPGASAGLSAGTLGPWRYLLAELTVHWRYLGLALLPVGQTVDHLVAPSAGLLAPATLAAGLGLLALAGGAVAVLRRTEPSGSGGGGEVAAAPRLAATGLLWWLLQLAPTSSLVPIDDLMAEHRTYLALLGLGLAAAAGGDLLRRRLAPERPWAPVAGAALIGLLLAGTTAARAQVWRSDWGLWDEAVRRGPSNARARANRAFALQERGRYDEALADYLAALPLATTQRTRATITMNLSALHLDRHRPAEALAVTEAAVRAGAATGGIFHNQATAFRLLGRFPEALAAVEQALAALPGDPDLLDTRGLIRYGLGDRPGALGDFEAAAAVEQRPIYYVHQAVTLGDLGRRGEACDVLTYARRLAPTDRRVLDLAGPLGCR